jgi:hypothetical protein
MAKNKNKPKNISQLNNAVSLSNAQSSDIVNTNQQSEQSVSQSAQITVQFTHPILVPADQWNALNLENIELKAKLSQMSADKTQLLNIISQNGATIEELKKENEKLKQMYYEILKQNKLLTEEKDLLITKNNNLEEKLDELIQKEKLVEALSKIHDCDAMSNKAFKYEYKSYFKLKKYDNNVPNIGDFVLNPPDKNTDSEYYDFWFKFCKKYPNSDNINFRTIYDRINKDRVTNGAHSNIYKLPKLEFDKYLKIAVPDIHNSNKQLCIEYRNWLYLFE